VCVFLFFRLFRLFALRANFSSLSLLLLLCFSIITKNISQNLISSYIMSLWVDKYRPIELNQCEHVNASVANHLKELVQGWRLSTLCVLFFPFARKFSNSLFLLRAFQNSLFLFLFLFLSRARFFFKSRTLLYVYPR